MDGQMVQVDRHEQVDGHEQMDRWTDGMDGQIGI